MLLQRLTLISSLLLGSAGVAAQTAPAFSYPCVPGLYGTTLDVASPKRYDQGWRLMWICEKEGKAIAYGLVCVHGTCVESTLRNTYMAASTASNPKDAIDSALAKNLTSDTCATTTNTTYKQICEIGKTDMLRFVAEYIAKNPKYAEQPPPPPPPVITYTVAPNPLSTTTPPTRPTYAWDSTTQIRSTRAAAERVEVGSPCDEKIGKVESGGAYYGVLGRSDRVALCKQQQ